jgi:phosphatidylinositol 4-kinase
LEDGGKGVDLTQRVRENAFPALVGMGAMLAGIGQSLVTKPVGSVAIAQGRKARTSTFNSANASVVVSRRNTFEEQDRNDKSKLSFQSDSQLPIRKSRPTSVSSAFSAILGDSNHFSVSLEDLHQGKAFSVSRYLKQAQQKINHTMRSTLISHDANAPSQLLNGGGMDPANMKAMAQSSVPIAAGDDTTPTTPTTPNGGTSSPSLSVYSDEALGQSPPKRSASLDFKNFYNPKPTTTHHEEEDLVNNSSESDDDEIYALAKLSLDDRRNLLRSNYFRSEMQFLLALVDIATRLVIVPKPARLSALHAELTLLNHNLPAEICMPLWCPATVDRPYHHRIVRISPTDAVVLNSAERVTFINKKKGKITNSCFIGALFTYDRSTG